MNVTNEDKKIEALKRIKELRLHPNVAKGFENSNLINFSVPPLGGLFWATEEDKERIKKFENEHNALVYTGIRSYTTIGQLDSYLFVSDYKEEWDMDNEGIRNGDILAYVYNHAAPDFSEIGYISIETLPSGGLLRVA